MPLEPESIDGTDVAYVLCDPIDENKSVAFINVATDEEETIGIVEEDRGCESWDEAMKAARENGYRYVRRDVYLAERDEDDSLIDLEGPMFSTWRQVT